MKRACVVGALCAVSCIPAAVHAGGSGPGWEPEPQWSVLHFDSLERTLARVTVISVVSTLGQDASAGYLRALETGEVWVCIGMILERLATLEAVALGSGTFTLDDTVDGMLSHQMRHSGRLWSFWNSLAALKLRAAGERWTDVFDEEVDRVLREMEVALTPHLRDETNEW